MPPNEALEPTWHSAFQTGSGCLLAPTLGAPATAGGRRPAAERPVRQAAQSSEFEFFTVAISMILAFANRRLLDGLAPAISRERRYWIHVGWIVQMRTSDSLAAPIPAGIAVLAIPAFVGIATQGPRAHAAIVVLAPGVQTLGLGAAMFRAGGYQGNGGVERAAQKAVAADVATLIRSHWW
jgi:hypothetical protein